MKKLQLSLCVCGAYIILVAIFAIVGARPATGQKGSPPGPDVRVINTPSEPVPVTGNIKVSSLPTGPIPVSVTSLPTVQLDTTQPIPVSIAGQSALQPFAREASVFTTLASDTGSFAVPAGKRLYIETVSVRGSVPQGHVPFTNLNVTTGGETVTHPLPVTLRGFDGVQSDQYVGLHEVRIVADAGSTVEFRAFRRSGGGTMALGMTVSGHLEDL